MVTPTTIIALICRIRLCLPTQTEIDDVRMKHFPHYYHVVVKKLKDFINHIVLLAFGLHFAHNISMLAYIYCIGNVIDINSKHC